MFYWLTLGTSGEHWARYWHSEPEVGGHRSVGTSTSGSMLFTCNTIFWHLPDAEKKNKQCSSCTISEMLSIRIKTFTIMCIMSYNVFFNELFFFAASYPRGYWTPTLAASCVLTLHTLLLAALGAKRRSRLVCLFAEELCSQWPFRYKTCGEGMPTPSPERERHEEQRSRSQHWMHFLFLLILMVGLLYSQKIPPLLVPLLEQYFHTCALYTSAHTQMRPAQTISRPDL